MSSILLAQESQIEISYACHGDQTTVQEDPCDGMIEVRVCVVGDALADNVDLTRCLEKLNLPVVYSPDGSEYYQPSDQFDTVFVLDHFDGSLFKKLAQSEHRVVGPSLIMSCAHKDEALPYNSRPIYCRHMSKLVVCFTGFLEKELLKRMAELVHHMGGSVRKDFTSKVTHLIANNPAGSKYKAAVSLGTPIMTQQWVHESWNKRDDITVSSVSENMMVFKMKPFHKCVLCFIGFSDEEQEQMEGIAVEQGGSISSASDQCCTHIVVDDITMTSLPFEIRPKVTVVKQEWFWSSIKIDACADADMYVFNKMATPAKSSSVSTPTSKSRKRRRLRESIAQLSHDTDHMESPGLPRKRRSSVLNETGISASSVLDASQTPEASVVINGLCTPMEVGQTPKQPVSRRQQTLMELLQTETNYVAILSTIIKVFKEPLEQHEVGGPLLPPEDIKTMFGKVPDIHQVHCRLREDLQELLKNYSEEKSVGVIIEKHSTDIMKAYPPFVNFYEIIKQTVEKSEKTRPRFHAFMKIQQSKPECSRQRLTDLLIRPVQRLPSMILLLSDLLRRTDKTNPDHSALGRALDALKQVTDHINEDKRKTEGHTQMFDVISEIDGVPPTLLSAHRSYVTRIDTIEIGDREHGKGDNFSEKGGSVSMFLFTDLLEICKRRSKANSTSYKSPAVTKTGQHKCYKHIEVLPLSHIRRVLDIKQTDDCKNAFALLCKPPMEISDRTDRLFMFTLIGDEKSKTQWLKTLCQHMANITCKADSAHFLLQIEPEELELSKSDFENSKLGKAMRKAKKATRKVGRTFSWKGTPQLRLQRAMSTLSNASPMLNEQVTSMIGTPRSRTGKRLASVATLSRVMSPVRTRPPHTPKMIKNATIGPSSSSWL
ncbi:protein ECT2-like [Anneissia japonica]|uniref:protein ECT2-like n=1 Tax=Anneissia japonica TaxID=1529436 RepID=UPI001425B803|nr:protein ECT2-like [Anneissia japonica]XP_033121147.1 protein ECT2-like [Anneissia japonica]